eukprot:1116486-Rhodomonas_salina.2
MAESCQSVRRPRSPMGRSSRRGEPLGVDRGRSGRITVLGWWGWGGACQDLLEGLLEFEVCPRSGEVSVPLACLPEKDSVNAFELEDSPMNVQFDLGHDRTLKDGFHDGLVRGDVEARFDEPGELICGDAGGEDGEMP